MGTISVEVDIDDICHALDDDDIARIIKGRDVGVHGGIGGAHAEIRAGRLADAIRILSRSDDRLRDLEYLYEKVHGQ